MDLQLYLGEPGLRAAAVLLLAIAQALAAYWPEITGRPDTITSRSAAYDTPVVPFGPFFAIWLVIFASCIAFAIGHAHPATVTAPGMAAIGWTAAALFAGNVLWERHVPKHGLDRMSVVIIAVELAMALALLVLTLRLDLTGLDWWLIAFPLQLFAGWVSVALFANLSSTLLREGVSMDGPVPAVLLTAAGILTAIVALLTGSLPYAGASAWGLAGAAVSGWMKGRRDCAAIAAAGSAAALLAALAA